MIVPILAAALAWAQQDSLPDPPTYKLAAPAAKELDEAKARAAGRALAGTHRALPADVLKKGKWQKFKDGGWVWRMRLQSVSASGMRVHFSVFDVGASKVLLHERGGKKPEGPYTGKREEFWSDIVYGDSVLIEYAPADRKKAKKLPFTIDKISHQM